MESVGPPVNSIDSETICRATKDFESLRVDTDTTAVASTKDDLAEKTTAASYEDVATPASPNPSRTSLFHIYHKIGSNYIISPVRVPRKEKLFPRPKWKKIKNVQPTDDDGGALPTTRERTTDSSIPDGYFVHRPHVSFHHPPRVLRRGTEKRSSGPPFCLVHNSFLWRQWQLQFGAAIEAPGVVDPRGTVGREAGGVASPRDDFELRGYGVRSWRLWNETGKEYHREYNKAKIKGEGGLKKVAAAPVGSGMPKESDERELESLMELDRATSEPSPAPTSPLPGALESNCLRADEVVYLTWASPFSLDTRQYQFQYRGIDFCWKGTGTVEVERHPKLAFIVHYNHLKLVARVKVPSSTKASLVPRPEQQTSELTTLAPVDSRPSSFVRDVKTNNNKRSENDFLATAPNEGGGTFREICLGKYTSSVLKKKSGELEIFDGAIAGFLAKYLPSALPCGGETCEDDLASIKRTRFYDVVIATALCMVIGEWQKRLTVRKVAETLLAAGEGGGDSG
ncbi:hypothetical protein BDY21DRAFT_369429 [Lineolata rhizophorae]|uniref:Uncharacterized protein n=1 Tax=Lineolata rhizophorae TaxID=578093 RepID=A0A6A6P8U0_9PEZI|nr:hypothetical protein BDY21DRAFT_369429 [Lineolata rhizophorae]